MTGDTQADLTFGARGQFFRTCVLLVLAEDDRHGYELATALAACGYGKPDIGGLYRALRAMEQEGLVSSWWEAGRGPARRVYAITDAGVESLDGSIATARDALRRLDRLLSFYRRVSQGRGVPVPA